MFIKYLLLFNCKDVLNVPYDVGTCIFVQPSRSLLTVQLICTFFFSDSVRYHAAIKLVNISAIVNENINEFLQQKILKYVSTSIWVFVYNKDVAKHFTRHKCPAVKVSILLKQPFPNCEAWVLNAGLTFILILYQVKIFEYFSNKF